MFLDMRLTVIVYKDGCVDTIAIDNIEMSTVKVDKLKKIGVN